jgi:hypothetical protein
MAKKTKRHVKKSVKILIVALLVLIGGLIVFKVIKPNTKTIKKIAVSDKIEGYGYTLNENATSYQKKLFKNLKTLLEGNDVDDEEYAKLVAKSFIADFYTLDNKLTSNDIGGVQYVYKDYRKDFSKYASESIYHTVQSNIYGNRKQDLPVVSSIEIAKLDQNTVKYLNKEDAKGYEVDLTITYIKDLKYQEDVKLNLVHNGKKIEVVRMENNDVTSSTNE